MENRVAIQTSEDVNREIRQKTDETVEYYSRHTELIDNRLLELDKE